MYLLSTYSLPKTLIHQSSYSPCSNLWSNIVYLKLFVPKTSCQSKETHGPLLDILPLDAQDKKKITLQRKPHILIYSYQTVLKIVTHSCTHASLLML